jgi:two-component system, LytTR family, sensor kinase
MVRRRLLTIALYLGAWTCLALLAASQLILTYAYAGTGTVNVGAVLRVSLPLWYTWAALAPLVIALGRRLPLGAGSSARNLAIHIGLTLTFAIVAVAAYRLLRGLVGLPSQRAFGFDLITGIHTHVLTYWVLVGLVHVTESYRRARERDVRAAKLAAELSRARLDALRMQLHPHFLFNTMHAIAGTIRDDPAAAEDMLAELADLLRHTVERPDVHEVPLRDELDFIRRYLGIQKARLGDRLHVDIDAADATLDTLVPALVLQPLVENAIEHGIATRLSGGRLEIAARQNDTALTLTVTDDGPGIESPAVESGIEPAAAGAGERLGLRNTRARLAHLYGDDASLVLRSRDGGGLEAIVRVPRRSPAPAS